MSERLWPKIVSILRVMHDDVGKWYYTRELAKLAEVSTWTVSTRFSKLVDESLLEERREGREKYYKLNLANPRTRKYCELFEVEKREGFYKTNRGLSYGLRDLAERTLDFIPEVQSIILFGSTARGQATERSDVDLLVLIPNVAEERFKELMGDVDRLAGEVAGRHPVKFAPVTMSMRDFEIDLRERNRLAVDVLEDGIVLLGEERYYRLLSKVT